jgi:uncharacterized phage-associated protein
MKTDYAFNEEKTKQLILYLASKVDIGKTKLMKLLYLIDFTAYEKSGKPITNDTYEHWALGPVPTNVWKKCNSLISGIINQVTENRTTGKYTKFVPKISPNVSVFTRDERKIIDKVIAEYGEKFQRELVEMIHAELPYKLTQENEVIPYHLAPYRKYKKLSRAQLKKLRANKSYLKRLRDAYKQFQTERPRHATA